MGNGKWVMEMGNGKGGMRNGKTHHSITHHPSPITHHSSPVASHRPRVTNHQSRITLFLEAPRKRHRIAVAPHLGAVEEAQAQETNAAQRVAFDYHAVDVVK